MLNCRDTWLHPWQLIRKRHTLLVRKDTLTFAKGYCPRSILPADENRLTFFSTYMACYVKTETNKVYLAAIRYMHIINGYNLDLQSFLRLQYVLKGIKRTQGQSKRVRLPITLTHLKLFQLLLSSPSTHNEMLWAALTLVFFGLLRVSGIYLPRNI